ncbi:MAG: hypothetical protein U0640_04450 [Phycisphaerales bacterium]
MTISHSHRLVHMLLALVAVWFSPDIATTLAQGCDPQWLPGDIGRTVEGEVHALASFDPDGAGPQPLMLIAGGRNIFVPGMSEQKILGFDGVQWRVLDHEQSNPSAYIEVMTVFNNELIVAGRFSSIDGVPANNIARWNGTTWSPLGEGVLGNYLVRAVAVHQGSLYVGGFFPTVGPNIPVNGLARWNGTQWSNIGGTNTNGTVYTLLSFFGSLYVGGSFTSVGGVAANNLARWNGTSWSAVGQPDDTVTSLAQYTGDAIGSEVLFVGGYFNNIGASPIPKLVRYSPSANTWTAIGPLPSGTPRRLLVRLSGFSYQLSGVFVSSSINGTFNIRDSSGWHQLGTVNDSRCTCAWVYGGQYVVGRDATYPDTFPNVKAWNSTDWVSLGHGVPAEIARMSATNNNEVFAATYLRQSGGFNNINSAGVFRHNLATNEWTALGGTFAFPGLPIGANISALASFANGDVVAGGNFSQIGSVTANNIAKWNGTAWSGMGTFSGTVSAVVGLPNGDVIAGGSFNTINGAVFEHLARWNGTSWTSVGGGVNGSVYELKFLPNGNLLAVGSFATAGSVTVNKVARWDGTYWNAYGNGIQTANTSVLSADAMGNGNIVAGGYSVNANNEFIAFVSQWNGSSWGALGSGIGPNNPTDAEIVGSVSRLPDGSVVVAGNFSFAGGIATANIARWDGAWHAMGASGLSYYNDYAPSGGVSSTVVLPDGTLCAGGLFGYADSNTSAFFARWRVPTNCSGCDSIDFNNDTSLFDPTDIEAFLSVYSEGPCIPANATCNDVDFNNDTSLFDPCDINSFLVLYSEGPCTPCGV